MEIPKEGVRKSIENKPFKKSVFHGNCLGNSCALRAHELSMERPWNTDFLRGLFSMDFRASFMGISIF